VRGSDRSRWARPRAATRPKESAYDAAARYLATRPRSILEVRRHLTKKRYDERDVAAAVSRLQDAGHLDDRAFARYWLEQRARFRPKGPLGLRSELRAKGVSAAIVGAVLGDEGSGYSEGDAVAAALSSRAARWRGLPEQERKAKAQAFLRQRGFSFDAIDEALERL
jgi:regulatory protein